MPVCGETPEMQMAGAGFAFKRSKDISSDVNLHINASVCEVLRCDVCLIAAFGFEDLFS